MKKQIKTTLIILGVLVVAVTVFVVNPWNSGMETNDFSCEINEDCVKVDAGCCGCNEGGEAIAIHKDKKDSRERQLEKNCSDVMCPQVISDHPSCSKEAVCNNGKCVLE